MNTETNRGAITFVLQFDLSTDPEAWGYKSSDWTELVENAIRVGAPLKPRLIIANTPEEQKAYNIRLARERAAKSASLPGARTRVSATPRNPTGSKPRNNKSNESKGNA